MYEEEEEFHHLERKYNEAENILENLLEQLAVIKQTAPSSDIAEVAEDRIEAAQDIIEEAREELEEVQELLWFGSGVLTHLHFLSLLAERRKPGLWSYVVIKKLPCILKMAQEKMPMKCT